ncbi:MAG: BTAD domain-containing putative transcriptional regulator [Acidimicrobiales bacterium]
MDRSTTPPQRSSDDNVDFNVLGPVTVTQGGSALDSGGPKQRAVLAMLVARVGQPVSVEAIAEAVYGDAATPRQRRTVQSYVSTLRRHVGDAIVKTGSGWMLDPEHITIDAVAFEDEYRAAEQLDDPAAAVALRQALGMWRGHPYADIEAHGALVGEIARLTELRVAAQQARIDADLSSGRDRDLIGEIESVIADHPYHERFRAQHMLALYRSGRQQEALRSYQDLRTLLLDDLGVDPSPDLQELEQRILDHDDALRVAPTTSIQRRAILVADPGDPLVLAQLGMAERDRRLVAAASIVRSLSVVEGAGAVHVAGTATYVVFETATDAARAAEAISRQQNSDQLQLSIDWGDIEAADSSVSGPPVLRAATLVALAHPGQVLISGEAQNEIVAAGEASGLRFESLGREVVPGIEGETAIFQLLVGDPPRTFAPLKADRVPPPLPLGGAHSVPGYELREPVGSGSIGTLYRAYQPSVGREVLVEVIPRATSADAEFVRAFEADAQRLSLLDHPNIAALLDYWRDIDGAYLVYRHHRGGRLASGADATPVRFAQICAALSYAHSYGVVHGSLRPDRVMLDESGNVRLIGFSLAGVRPTGSSEHPAYVAPELLRGAAISPATDAYALGVLATEMESGPAGGDAAITSGRENIRGALSDDPADRPSVLSLSSAGTTSDDPEPTVLSGARNPYKGLAAYHERDAADFFGRRDVVDELVAAVGGSHLVAVVGPSGIGKSSVVRAGLVPALRGGGVAGSSNWLITDMLPGSHPFLELRRALERVAVDLPSSLADSIASGDPGALDAIERVLPGGGDLLVIVDQFEELFTLTPGEEAAAFLELVTTTVKAGYARFVLTMRADFLDRPLLYSAFGDLLGDCLQTLAAPGRGDLAEAVIEPARAVGVDVEPALVERVIADVVDRPGALPLLQHALVEVFEERDVDRLDLHTYESVGGVTGALARRADQTCDALGADVQDVLRQVLLRLVTVSDDAAPTRRRVQVTELHEGAGDVVEALVRARLLVYDRDPDTRTPTVEVAHEALLAHWPRLARWIEEVREDLTLSRRLDDAVTDWEAGARSNDHLLTEGRLAQHLSWTAGTELAISPASDEFLGLSEAHDTAVRTRRRRLRTTAVGALASLAVVALLLAVIAQRNSRQADDEAARARAASLSRASDGVVEDDAELAVLLGIAAISEDAEYAPALGSLANAVQVHRGGFEPSVPDEGDPIHAAVSPDGSLLAITNTAEFWVQPVGSDERLWDWGDGVDGIARLEFTEDGRHLVASVVAAGNDWCEGDTWMVFDARTGAVVQSHHAAGTLGYRAGPAQSGPYVDLSRPIIIADSSDMEFCGDFPLEVDLLTLDLLTGATEVIARGSNGAGVRFVGVPTLDVSGGRLATAGEELEGSVIDLETGEELLELPRGMSTLSRDGSVVLAGQNPLELWDVDGQEKINEFGGEFHAAWFSPSETMVYGVTSTGRLLIYDIETGETRLDIGGVSAELTRAQMTDDETTIATTAADGSVRVWDVGHPIRATAGPEILPATVTSGEDAFYFLGNSYVVGDRLVAARGVTELGDATCEFCIDQVSLETAVYDLVSGDVLSRYPGWVIGVSTDGSRVAYQATGPPIDLTENPGGEVDEDERLLYRPVGPMVVADLMTGRVIKELDGLCRWLAPPLLSRHDPIPLDDCSPYPGPWREGAQSGVFSPDGSMFAVAGESGRFAVWLVETGEMIWSRDVEQEDFQPGAGRRRTVAFSPDGAHLVVTDRRSLEVLDVATWGVAAEYENEIAISKTEFTPDGRFLVMADWSVEVIVLETEAWTETQRMVGQQGFTLPDISGDPTGRFVATAGLDNDVRVWNIETGELVQLLEIPEVTVGLRNVEWVDEHTLYVGTRPWGALLTLDTDALVEAAGATLTRSFTGDECRTYEIDPCPSLAELVSG